MIALDVASLLYEQLERIGGRHVEISLDCDVLPSGVHLEVSAEVESFYRYSIFPQTLMRDLGSKQMPWVEL